MEEHLWELEKLQVEESGRVSNFDNWDDFIISKIWNRNYYYGCLPVYWVWCDKENKFYDFDEDYKNFEDHLALVYLSLAPCDARSIFIKIKRENEKDVKKWLTKHNFIK